MRTSPDNRMLKPRYRKWNDTFEIATIIDGVEQPTVMVFSPEEFNKLKTEMYEQDQVREAIMYLKEFDIEVDH